MALALAGLCGSVVVLAGCWSGCSMMRGRSLCLGVGLAGVRGQTCRGGRYPSLIGFWLWGEAARGGGGALVDMVCSAAGRALWLAVRGIDLLAVRGLALAGRQVMQAWSEQTIGQEGDSSSPGLLGAFPSAG
ncbi:MAG TPA: hypothetical protein VFV38_43005 [Ktedonobacteraceae bacterium]|nr:hypothetical protein [Ktedonobacteraceae bacterium]